MKTKREMSTRQAFAKIKKMFPEARMTVEKIYTKDFTGYEYSHSQVYVRRPGDREGIWILSLPTFEEAIKELKDEINDQP